MPALIVHVNGTIPVAEDFNFNNNALNGVCGANTTISSYVQGDMLYASGPNKLDKLTIGADGSQMIVSGGIPSWTSGGVMVGTITGLAISNDVTTPNTVLDIATGACPSDEAVLSNRTLMYLPTAITKNMNAAFAQGTGNGGNNAGSALNASAWYHVFVIKRQDTGAVDVMADTSLTPTLPSGFTKKRWIYAFKTDGSSHIIPALQDGDRVTWNTPVLDVTTTNPGTSALLATLASVPPGVTVYAEGNLVMQVSATGNGVLLTDPALPDVAPSLTLAPLATLICSISNQINATHFSVRTNTSQQIRYRHTASGADVVVRFTTLGWRRGSFS